jgi:hypothetical protein
MPTIDDLILNILEGNTNPDKLIIEHVQNVLLFDCNQTVSGNYIQEIAKNGKTEENI